LLHNGESGTPDFQSGLWQRNTLLQRVAAQVIHRFIHKVCINLRITVTLKVETDRFAKLRIIIAQISTGRQPGQRYWGRRGKSLTGKEASSIIFLKRYGKKSGRRNSS
jgi:hypothetical protein